MEKPTFANILAILFFGLACQINVNAQVFDVACAKVIVTPSPAGAPDLIRPYLPIVPGAVPSRVIMVSWYADPEKPECKEAPAAAQITLTYTTADGKSRKNVSWAVFYPAPPIVPVPVVKESYAAATVVMANDVKVTDVMLSPFYANDYEEVQ